MTIQSILIGNMILLVLIFLILLVISMTNNNRPKKIHGKNKKVKEDLNKIKEQIEGE